MFVMKEQEFTKKVSGGKETDGDILEWILEQ